MNNFYVRGPNGSWGGVCEVNRDTGKYIHHFDWPLRSETEHSFPPTNQLPGLLARKEWQLMVPDAIRLPDGI